MEKRPKIETHADAVIYFIQKLDIEMVDMLLDDTREYQDMKKEVFIEKFGMALDEFIEDGDAFLNATIHVDTTNGFCGTEPCGYKCKGFSFVGNNSGDFIDLIFEIVEGRVVDIFECSYFKTKESLDDNCKRVMIDDFF